MKRRTVGVIAVTAVLLTGVGVVVGRSTSDAAPTSAASTAAPHTADVTRRTLTRTKDVDGVLGYGDSSALSLALPGMLTWLPEVGSTIDRGSTLARVDDRPVVALLGSVPLYRPLSVGLRGPDVRQLKDNLEVLGYAKPDSSDRYTAATASAVRAWQKDLGLTRTGTVNADWVSILPAPVRVAQLTARPGMPATGEIFQTTGSDRIVTANLSVSTQDLAVVGHEVSIRLPGGATATGTITSVGSPQLPDAESGQEADLANAVIPVTVRIADPASLAGAEVSPVVVTFVAEERLDVLTVPVNALLALPEGGYGVEVVTGATTHIVPVTTGMFADGAVEISATEGHKLAEGDKVVVPQ